MASALGQLGISLPAPDDYPSALSQYFRRRIWPTTVGQLRAVLAEGEPVFAKPRTSRKRFTGRVFADAGGWPLPTMPSGLELWCSDPVAWQSEFRVFVAHGRVLGVRWYDGDPAIEPDEKTIRDCVAALGTKVDGYAFDVGVLDSGATAVVEVNDGFAIGTYGLEADAVARVLVARWKQLVRDASGSAHA